MRRIERLLYRSLKTDTEFYDATCTVKNRVDVRVSGLSEFQEVVVASDVKCRIVRQKASFTDPEQSVSKEREYVLYLLDSPLLKDSYYFSDFVNTGLSEPNARYIVVKTGKSNQVAGKKDGQTLYAYSLTVRRIDRDI